MWPGWLLISTAFRPLGREPAIGGAFLDADALFSPDFTKILDAAQISRQIRNSLLQLRASCRGDVRARLAQEQGLDPHARENLKLKHDVIAKLTEDEREIFKHLIDRLAQFGLFMVPVGELECWLPPFGLTPNSDNKRKWLEAALAVLGWDPEDIDYKKPQDGDIWTFIRRVAAWIADPQRGLTSAEN